MTGPDVTMGELWRQGEQIRQAVTRLEAKGDATHDVVTRHDGDIARNGTDIAEIRAELKSKRVTTATIAGLIATIITVAGEVLGHLK